MFLQSCIIVAAMVVGQADALKTAAIGDVLRQFTEARNARDATAMLEFFTDDADFGTSRGTRAEGKQAIGKRFAASFVSGPYSKATLKQGPTSVRMLSPDCAIADFEWELVGLLSVDGEQLPARVGMATVVLVKKDNRWLIAAMRSMVPAKE